MAHNEIFIDVEVSFQLGGKTFRYVKNTSCCTFTLQMPDAKILILKKNTDLATPEKRSATSWGYGCFSELLSKTHVYNNY
ncbi:hypothetical protein SAMN05444280_13731 [Tangfeifania diversioriginum]|uniref:Uncharacterized protein n=1 Tax=Tangfeifania diversioriginum TaxID=1168035 RepID=A0A1M6MZ30_9BACT|nr:hypothetical protein SAMN05444280_13731 [Tangfeifania diversioriginum]